MVDSILDNLSLRTQRKGELRLELELKTSSEKLQQFIGAIKTILSKKEIESSSVLMDTFTGNAFIVNADYYTAAVTQNEFDTIKETVNLSVLKLMESMEIQMAGAGHDIRIIEKEKH